MRPLAMNEFTTIKWSFEEDVRNYAAAGYQGIGVVRTKVEAYGIDRAVPLLKEHNLKVTDVCIVGGFTEPDPESFKQKIQDTRRGIETAARLQADALIVFTGPPGVLTPPEAFGLLRRALDEILPYAEQMGIRLALEPTHPMYRNDGAIIMTLAEGIELCEAINSPNLGLWLDTYLIWWDNTLLEQLPRARGRILGVHVNDWKKETRSHYDWGVPGEGVIPLHRILAAIQAAGWNGLYTIEIFSDFNQPDDYPQILQRSREGFEAIWSER